VNPGLVFHRRLGVKAYEVLTSQDLWRDHIARILDHAGPLDPENPPRLLDLGCGPGESAFVLAERLGPRSEIVGVDISSPMIERARRILAARGDLPNVSFEVADAAEMALADSSFDLAVGHSFLYLTDRPEAVLAEVRRVLRPTGRLLLMEPNGSGSLLGAARELERNHAGHLWQRPLTSTRFLASMLFWRLFGRASRCRPPEELRSLLEAAGFAEVEIHPTLGGLGLHCVALNC